MQGGREKNPLECNTRKIASPEKNLLEFEGVFFGEEKPQPFFKKRLRFFCPEKNSLEINTPGNMNGFYFQGFFFGAEKPQPFFRKGLLFFCREKNPLEF